MKYQHMELKNASTREILLRGKDIHHLLAA